LRVAMKLQFIIAFSVLLVSVGTFNVIAAENAGITPDTVKFQDTTRQSKPDTSVIRPYMSINIFTGIMVNSTLGTHPVIAAKLRFSKNNHSFDLVYEYRFGNSAKDYQIEDNDTLKNTNIYNANYLGLEYQKAIFRIPHHDFYLNTGIGLDWIEIKKNGVIKTSQSVGGLALNLGVSYTFYNRKKHGPNIEVLYHYANITKVYGTKISPGSLLVRLTYYLGKGYR
jgi:hypothetical protein